MNISGVESSIPDLIPLLITWVEVVQEYCDLDPYQTKPNRQDVLADAPYWYNEWATVSTVVCAVGRAGGLALSEAWDSRTQADGTTKKGRPDLWFRLAEKEYITEAKQIRAEISSKPPVGTERRFNEAVSTAEALGSAQYEMKAFGSIFIVPRTKPDGVTNDREIRRYVQLVCDEVQHDFSAWCFPLNIQAKKIRDTERCSSPGVIWLGRLAKGKTKRLKRAS